MFRSLLYRVRTLPAAWRDDLLVYWFTRDKSQIGFFAMLVLPIAVLGFLIHLAYADRIRMAAAQLRSAELQCLAENVYFEARGEPLSGQYAVAEVTLNRVASPRFPGTICDVVHEARWDGLRRRRVGAFSWTELDSVRRPRGAAWEQALAVATAMYDDPPAPLVPGALFYHATTIHPSWGKSKQPIATIGSHVFYR